MTDEEIARAYEEYAKDKPFPYNLEYETFRAGVRWCEEETIRKDREFRRRTREALAYWRDHPEEL